MKSTTKKTKTTKKPAKQLERNTISKAQKKLNEFIELLKSNKVVMDKNLKNELEQLIKNCVLSGKVSNLKDEKPQTKEERLAKLKETQRILTIQDSPRYKYDAKHVEKLMRLLDVDKKTAKTISATEKMRSNLHVPYVENSLDKTMAVEFDIYNSCISSIDKVRFDEKAKFTTKKAMQSIDRGLKKIKKINPKIVDKWEITSKQIQGSDYIYVDVDYKTTLNTHRHIFKLSPAHSVASSQFFDDTKTETLDGYTSKSDDLA